MNSKLAIGKMAARIARKFDPEQIVLFGSHARGTAGPDSDVDLLVVMPVNGSKRQTQVEIRCALRDIRLPKDIVVATPAEVRQQRKLAGTLIRPAMEEGRVLYAKR